MKVIQYIRDKPLHAMAIAGAILVATGLVLLMPSSPWSLVVLGGALIFISIVSALTPS